MKTHQTKENIQDIRVDFFLSLVPSRYSTKVNFHRGLYRLFDSIDDTLFNFLVVPPNVNVLLGVSG